MKLFGGFLKQKTQLLLKTAAPQIGSKNDTAIVFWKFTHNWRVLKIK